MDVKEVLYILKTLGMNQKQIADNIGVSDNIVSKWVRDEAEPSYKKYLLLLSLAWFCVID